MKKIMFFFLIATFMNASITFAEECLLEDCLTPASSEHAKNCDWDCRCFAKFEGYPKDLNEWKKDPWFHYKVCQKNDEIVFDSFYYGFWPIPKAAQRYFKAGQKGIYRIDTHGRIYVEGKHWFSIK